MLMIAGRPVSNWTELAAATGPGETDEVPLGDLIIEVANQARVTAGLEVSAFVAEGGVCVLVAGSAPAESSVVARVVTDGAPVTAGRTAAAPVISENGDVVAVFSSRWDDDDSLPRLQFLAEVAAARLRRPERAPEAPEPELGYETSFRPLFDAANFSLLVLDLDGTITYANPFVERLTGIPAKKMIGHKVSDPRVYSPVPSETERQTHRERVLNGSPTSGEVSIRIVSGEHRTFSFTLSPVRGSDGQLSHILASAIDITERRAAEHRLHLANEALEQARIQAEASAAARTEFLARMSHEIRTPLNAIIGTTSLMLDQAPSDAVTEHTEILRSSADHLLAVINDILDITRLDTGESERDEDTIFAVDALVESSLDLVMGKAAAKGLEVASFVEPGTASHLRGDASRVRQILVNLLNNAVKYTDTGRIELVARTHYIGSDRVELVFEITDTGPGIEPDRLATLFDPFTRGSGTESTIEGTGLGLSISERLATMLDGRISVQSKVGEGSRFTVSIPFDTHQLESSVEPVDTPEGFDGLEVLVVDDIELNRRVLGHETRRWGMKPTLCSTARDALALVDGGRKFDFALLDCNMPDMDGEELAELLSQRASFPLILVSSSPATRPELFASTLPRPVRRTQLARSIEQALTVDIPDAVADPIGDAHSGELRILLAEDNAVNQKVADALLRRLGHTATIVGDGALALAELDRNDYDLVIVDLRMPNMDGIETATEIVKRFGCKRPRIVALTASATEQDRQLCFEVGMDDFVTKPVTLAGLERVIDEAERSLVP